ncbi:heavy-metal-associated domain-containing protein [Phocicoccus pinnipedialis]|uniref:Copper chaperone CopZ n=1 Tax=Phocicoccus pinnipedialis TaxID=110845 RepID=A0A6V7R3T5_9BACL|nr:heavy-metal-associated domain-containing protein [Jeotgalicoccus pinnipedialis]MBP1939983.1 copper chaperone CopZ [Jeotgalicoccus pinnipedialis]CAD2072069.1 Copper chaperone CopZ [Jeotgalicoccus pinnipedialis]
MIRTQLTTDTLTCPSCIKKIETGLKSIEGVDTVDVNFNVSRVKINHSDQVTADELKERVEKLGYPVKSVRTTA